MSQYFKRLNSLLFEIYKEFPQMRRHPEYRFFYLHCGYPEVMEYFFVITENIPLSDRDEFFVFINTTARTFGFVEGVMMKEDDFNKYIGKSIENYAKDLRGSEFKVFGYEVW